ncbi:DUF6644 family protein [Bordetella genomosp. 4]|uniref:DUF2214 domain-containing protein n=1 Tax=Bordetella genomosp. 4 TaxID=463044 RepID=A0A261U2I4_9BORD|nr:DUF6644 family protein [Bordetella genomosp. 4]OZI56079.1 DUF2214 domain-containing protein [Bordetella genomosp. 4]
MLDWIAGWPLAAMLRRSGTAYLLVNAGHVASIGLLFGAIAALDLRLLGAARTLPLATAGPYLSRLAAAGLLAALLTGMCLFAVNPQNYLDNSAFLAKLGLLALGIANALWLHYGGPWRQAMQSESIPTRVKLHAAMSLFVWLGAIVAGRWIGFL